MFPDYLSFTACFDNEMSLMSVTSMDTEKVNDIKLESPSYKNSLQLRGTASRYAVGKSSNKIWIRPPRVLLVEDDAVCLGLSARLLKLFGCDLDIVTDGFSAVARIGESKYDLVLMDVGLPGMDGVQAAARIRSFDHQTPIITMTGHTTAHECLTYLSNGMNDILAKPFRKEMLWEMLEKHCRHLEAPAQTATLEEGMVPALNLLDESHTVPKSQGSSGYSWQAISSQSGNDGEMNQNDNSILSGAKRMRNI